jgi:hypothetical protein
MDLKNRTKIQHKNPPNLNRPKSTKNHKIDENRSKNRRKSPKSTFGGFFGPKKARSGVEIDGPTIAKRTHLGEQNALFQRPFLFGRAIFTTESNTKNRAFFPPKIGRVYIYNII